jgi:hypothetical protein
MKPNKLFLSQPKSFWANVRTISQGVGYTQRTQKQIKIPTVAEIKEVYADLELKTDHILEANDRPTKIGKLLFDYFQYRADILNKEIKPLLMDAPEAEKLFKGLRKKLKPSCPIPMNKQKGKMRKPAFLTGMVNMIIEQNADGIECDYDPRALTTVTVNGSPVRTLARRVDGAFPATINPIAVWEIKEYYYTTTFGSRVADGVYETLLDGMELEELKGSENIDVKHYLMVDSHFTWWECGRSYLCRIIDMLHMGYVDEVFFGKEVVSSLPDVVKEWVKVHKSNRASGA